MSLHGQVPPEPDLVQLLTPEGIRVSHPDFPLEITDDAFDAVVGHLVETLTSLGVPAETIGVIGEKLSPLRSDIVSVPRSRVAS